MVASCLARSTPEPAVLVRSLAGTFCCVLGKDTTLTVPLSTQVSRYKWVSETLMLGGEREVGGGGGGNPAMD